MRLCLRYTSLGGKETAMKKEKGEVMLESLIIMTLTLFILIWLLGLGFMHYQRYLLTVVTNDAAAKVAATYNNPTSDLVLGYMAAEDITSRDLYRSFSASNLVGVSQQKAENYIVYMLDRTNFMGTIDHVEVNVKFVQDTIYRRHIQVDSVCTFRNPFGNIMSMFGMSDTMKCAATGRADCTDVIDYVNTVDVVANATSLDWTSSKLVKMVNGILEVSNHIYKVFTE